MKCINHLIKKLFISILCLGGLLGCIQNQPKTPQIENLDAYSKPVVPYDLSFGRGFYYQQDDTINPQLFSFKSTFLSEGGEYNQSSKLADSPPAHSVIARGFALLGTPYTYGGQTVQSGFDCSGFVSYLFREEASIDLPRSTRQMINVDAPKVARSELEPGDLVFFATNGGRRVSHIGIYVGNQYFIHAASKKSGVRIDSLSKGYWSTRYLEAKRVLN